MPRSCRHTIQWGAALCALVASAVGAAWTQAPPEAVVKAAFVRRFAEFVQWPATVMPARSAVVLCLSPSQPFGSLVQQVAKGAETGGRPVTIRELHKGDRPVGCHVLYVAPADHDLLPRVRDLPVLTIGDEVEFCRIGGIINLQVVDGRVRFEISLSQARRANLKIESQLLRLATHLHGGQP